MAWKVPALGISRIEDDDQGSNFAPKPVQVGSDLTPTTCQSTVLGKEGSRNKHILLSQDSKFFRKLRLVDRTACSIIKTSVLLQFEFQTTVPQNSFPSHRGA